MYPIMSMPSHATFSIERERERSLLIGIKYAIYKIRSIDLNEGLTYFP